MLRLSFVCSTPLFEDHIKGRKLCMRRPQHVSRRVCRTRCTHTPMAVDEKKLETAEVVIRVLWDRCSTGKFTSWLPLFSESATYYDTLYPKPFVGKPAIAQHLENMESAIPPSIKFVLDEVAAGSSKVGARWHAETGSGVAVPFSRGASMYSFVEEDGKLVISEAWDFVETPFKVAGVILPVLRAAAASLRWLESRKNSMR